MNTLSTLLNTALTSKYRDPLAYHEYVTRRGRNDLAKDVASQFTHRLSQEAVVLDLAAGTGIISKALVKHGFNVIATDHYSEMLKKIEPGTKIETKTLDYNKKFDIEDNSVDGVTIVWGNRYISNIDHFLSEISRVLKPGGVFVWPYFNLEFFLWLLMGKPEKAPTVNNLKKNAEHMGFVVEHKIQRNPFSFTRCGYLYLSLPDSQV